MDKGKDVETGRLERKENDAVKPKDWRIRRIERIKKTEEKMPATWKKRLCVPFVLVSLFLKHARIQGGPFMSFVNSKEMS